MKQKRVSKGEGMCSSPFSGASRAKRKRPDQVRIRDRIKELRWVKAEDLLVNPNNYRRHPASQVAALVGVLEKVGYVDALLAREVDGGKLELIDGHLRAQTTPEIKVPVLVLDLNEEEAKFVLLTLDPLAGMAEINEEQLRALLENVKIENEAVQDLLERVAGPTMWAELHSLQTNEPEVSPERADELQNKWGTLTGQFWQIDRHRLVCGDSRDGNLIARLWSETDATPIRLIWTDPPYGVSYGAKTEWSNRHRAGRERRSIENDSLEPVALQKLFSDTLNVARMHALPGAAIYASVPSVFLKYFVQGLEDGGFAYKHCLVWVKQSLVLGRSDYHYRHEPILYGWIDNGPHYFNCDRRQDSVFEIDRPSVSEFHPTTKPVELIARMIANSTRAGELVFDPFAGSGSTIIAAHQLGRIGYGCELTPGFMAVALERLSMIGLRPELIETNDVRPV